MTARAQDFLTTAQFLIANGTTEGDRRSAISRAYYAAFHAVRNRTATDVVYDRSSDHSAARQHLRTRWRVDLSNTFSSLQDRRIEADYELGLTFSPSQAKFLVEKAAQFLRTVTTEAVNR